MNSCRGYVDTVSVTDTLGLAWGPAGLVPGLPAAVTLMWLCLHSEDCPGTACPYRIELAVWVDPPPPQPLQGYCGGCSRRGCHTLWSATLSSSLKQSTPPSSCPVQSQIFMLCVAPGNPWLSVRARQVCRQARVWVIIPSSSALNKTCPSLSMCLKADMPRASSSWLQ